MTGLWRGGSEALRISHIVTNASFAGTERYVLDVSAGLAARGHDVTVVGGRPLEMAREVSPLVRWQPGATAPQALRAIATGGQRDVVHSHTAKSDFVAVMAAPITRGVRVSTRHITAPRGFSPVARRLGRTVRALLARELAVSAWTSAQLERPADTVLLNGVHVQPDEPEGVVVDRERAVLVAQRFAPEKDTATALRAWAQSGLAHRGWRLRLAGDGELRTQLEQLANELGVSASIDFLGWVPDPGPHFASCAIFLAPAPTEPCGLSILQAMAYGLPVVAAGSGGTLETVGQFPNAALFPPGDSVAAASQLRRLAGDDNARREYGRGLRTLQRDRFTIAAHVDELEAIYREVLRGRQP